MHKDVSSKKEKIKMAQRYVVVLDKAPPIYTYAKDFFPRGTHYKKDAITLVNEVIQSGGKAHLEKKES